MSGGIWVDQSTRMEGDRFVCGDCGEPWPVEALGPPFEHNRCIKCGGLLTAVWGTFPGGGTVSADLPTPNHYTLGELIARLREEPDPSRRVKVGFRNPHSYRGYYEQLAFEIAEDVTVGEMLAAAESALGAKFHGWKGGEYKMSDYTDTWLVEREGATGETLGAVLLSLMLEQR